MSAPAPSTSPQEFPVDQIIAASAAGAIIWYLIATFLLHAAPASGDIPLLVVLVAGGAPLVFQLLRGLLRGQFGSDLLAGISIVVSLLQGQHLAGTVILLMLSGGASLENYAMRRASSVLAALARRMPRNAHRTVAGAMTEVPLEDLRIGDCLVVFPHENCPADGTVIEGHGSMDESYLTGEPYQISKTPGAEVLSGAVNGESAITIRVDRLPADSRYAKIVRVMEEAELQRPAFRRVGDRLGAWYTLLALVIAGLSWALSHDPHRFLAVLVIATPCPLLLAIPVAILGAISVAASRGIIVKDPSMLERIDRCRTMIFDKTGTLTCGKPSLTGVVCAAGMSRERALQLAAAVERYSRHPLAVAILDQARDGGPALAAVEVAEKPGEGLAGVVEGDRIRITGRKLVLKAFPAMAAELPPPLIGMESILLVNDQFGAAFQFRDTPRAESRAFIGHLAPRHGVLRVILLSGDRESEVLQLARDVGITEALFGKSPEEKVEIVRQESSRAPTMFLGDGINDAPAMQAATVGIAFGQNSDVTAEASDAVIFETSLRKVDELIHIGRRMRKIALQSAVGGMALSIFGMMLASGGYISPVVGAAAQEVIDVLAILNALRVALSSADVQSDVTAGN